MRILEHKPSDPAVVTTQEHLVGYCVAAGIVNRVRDVFSLFDQPTKDPVRPVPPYVQQCLRLLKAMTASRHLPNDASSSSGGVVQHDSARFGFGTSSSSGGGSGSSGGKRNMQRNEVAASEQVGTAGQQQMLKTTLVSGGSTLDLVVALQETATVRNVSWLLNVAEVLHRQFIKMEHAIYTYTV